MRMPVTLLMAIGKVALKHAGVGYVDDVFEIARAAWQYWKKLPKERVEEIAAIAAADPRELQEGIDFVVGEVAGAEPEAVRRNLAAFLRQVPEQVRQNQRRPEDPTGRTTRPGLAIEQPDDLVPFLPDRLPRFQPGDRPLPGVDWELAELLGMGGFGEVWKARHAHFGDSFAPVALKFGTDLDPSTRQRLLTYEAKVCARVMEQGRHAGIVALQQTYLSADPPCLQYEFVEGGDIGGLIGDWHRQGRKPSADLVARAVLQIAEVVAFMHNLKPDPLVHRDLKPANILVQKVNGVLRFRITDFGIGGIANSRAVQATRRRTTPSEFMTTAVRGSCTLLYAAPEQMLPNHDPDPRDDVHALGVIWFQMLTGDLTKGRPGGMNWRTRIPGLSTAMADLLQSCFEDEEDRPAHTPECWRTICGPSSTGARPGVPDSYPLPRERVAEGRVREFRHRPSRRSWQTHSPRARDRQLRRHEAEAHPGR